MRGAKMCGRAGCLLPGKAAIRGGSDSEAGLPAILPVRADRPLRGVLLRLASIICFILMSTALKACDTLPLGQLVFFRSLIGLLPILLFVAWQGELRSAFRTNNIRGHLVRGVIGITGMSMGFFALTRLPLPEATTINYAAPLITIVLGAAVLHEKVDAGKWLAVGVGLIGVLVIAWPRLTLFTSGSGLDTGQSLGALVALLATFVVAIAALTIRTLTRTEKSTSIVLIFSVFASTLSFCTIVFGWAMPTPQQWALLISGGVLGGLGQIFATEAFRHAEISTLAPLEYTSVILALGLGYVVFGDVPTPHMLIGGVLVVAAGLFVVFRASR